MCQMIAMALLTMGASTLENYVVLVEVVVVLVLKGQQQLLRLHQQEGLRRLLLPWVNAQIQQQRSCLTAAAVWTTDQGYVIFMFFAGLVVVCSLHGLTVVQVASAWLHLRQWKRSASPPPPPRPPPPSHAQRRRRRFVQTAVAVLIGSRIANFLGYVV